MFKIQLMYPKLKINVYFIFLNIGDLTFGIHFHCHRSFDALILLLTASLSQLHINKNTNSFIK
jgi:hypothetical protein